MRTGALLETMEPEPEPEPEPDAVEQTCIGRRFVCLTGRERLRRLLPCEVMRLLHYPSDFSWPRTVSMRDQWRMLGNGLHIGVVRRVLEHLLLAQHIVSTASASSSCSDASSEDSDSVEAAEAARRAAWFKEVDSREEEKALKRKVAAAEASCTDYDEAARQLFKRLNLSPSGDATVGDGATVDRYNNLDAVWSDPKTNAKVYIGNLSAAKSETVLLRHGIKHIVNCQDLSARNFHETNPQFHYLRFPVAHWFEEGLETHEDVLAYFHRCHGWIQEALDGGSSVLIHCLAGAHRAGTTGVSWLMHAAQMDRATATAAARQLRSVVDPFGHLIQILEKLEAAQQAQKSR